MTTGVVQTDTVLDRILKQTVTDLAERKAAVPEDVLEREVAASDRKPLSLAAALDRDTVAVIAEVKRGSPSRGMFPAEIDPAQIASEYCAGGAAAISCLTDGPFFHGSRQDLEQVAGVAHQAGLVVPVLRKDFIVDRYQLLEACVWGADVVLLIVAALDDALLASLHAECPPTSGSRCSSRYTTRRRWSDPSSSSRMLSASTTATCTPSRWTWR